MIRQVLTVIAMTVIVIGCLDSTRPTDEPTAPAPPVAPPSGNTEHPLPSIGIASSSAQPLVPDFAGARVCRSEDLEFDGRTIGGGLGHILAAITVRNVSSDRCAVGGYPKLQLLDTHGQPIHTDWEAAVTGDYMFPPQAMTPIGLDPGEAATVWIGSTDNPSGPSANAPMEIACPASAAVLFEIPGANSSIVVPIAMGPCNGWIDVSPFVPGADPPRF